MKNEKKKEEGGAGCCVSMYVGGGRSMENIPTNRVNLLQDIDSRTLTFLPSLFSHPLKCYDLLYWRSAFCFPPFLRRLLAVPCSERAAVANTGRP